MEGTPKLLVVRKDMTDFLETSNRLILSRVPSSKDESVDDGYSDDEVKRQLRKYAEDFAREEKAKFEAGKTKPQPQQQQEQTTTTRQKRKRGPVVKRD
jgi:hypothetical protein